MKNSVEGKKRFKRGVFLVIPLMVCGFAFGNNNNATTEETKPTIGDVTDIIETQVSEETTSTQAAIQMENQGTIKAKAKMAQATTEVTSKTTTHVTTSVSKNENIANTIEMSLCGGVTQENVERTRRWIEETKTSDVYFYSEYYDLSLSKSDYFYLSATTFAEASYPQTNEKELTSIASSIIKRVYEKFDGQETFEDVLFAPGQFSSTNNETKEVYYFDEPNVPELVTEEVITDIVYECVNRALEGEDPTAVMVTLGADSFYSDMYISDEEREKRSDVAEKIQFADTIFYRQNENPKYKEEPTE